MSAEFDHGPLVEYEITWKNGHVERVLAHQCLIPSDALSMFGPPPKGTPRVMFHGEFDGRWQLVLAIPESEVSTVRNVSRTEVL